MKYEPKESQLRRIRSAFAHHPPKDEGQVVRYGLIRTESKALACLLVSNCPDSRELNSALKCLEEAQSWAIASIARNES